MANESYKVPDDAFHPDTPLPRMFVYPTASPFADVCPDPSLDGDYVIVVTDSGLSCPMHISEVQHISRMLFGEVRIERRNTEQEAHRDFWDDDRKVGHLRWYYTHTEATSKDSQEKDYIYKTRHQCMLEQFSQHDMDHALVYFIANFSVHATEADAKSWDGKI